MQAPVDGVLDRMFESVSQQGAGFDRAIVVTLAPAGPGSTRILPRWRARKERRPELQALVAIPVPAVRAPPAARAMEAA